MDTSRSRGCLIVVLALLCTGFGGSSASAAPQLEPILSLTGNCSESSLDPIPDPGCPDPPHPGRFNEPRSVAIDAYGNEYVANYANGGEKGRIDVFDAEGFYITTLADPAGPQSVAVDSKGNLYVYERGVGAKIVRYPPSVYEPEVGNIAYANPPVTVDTATIVGNGLAIDVSNDHLFVARGGTVNEYGSANEENKLLDTIANEKLGAWSTWVAVDSQRRRLYASACRDQAEDCGVLVFDADGEHELLEEIFGPTPEEQFVSHAGWLSIAVDEETGHFFVDDLDQSNSVYEFDEDFEFVSELTLADFQGGQALQIAVSNSPLNEEAANRRYLFVPVVLQAGRVLAFEPPGVLPPELVEAGAGSIGETEAQLQASIDPRGGVTEYAFEYVTQADFESEGFANAVIAGEGTIPGTNLKTDVQVFVSSLQPGTGYRFRVRAENEAGEADPIGEAGFTTYFDALAATGPCPNQSLRIGLSATLPDCRTYELVTPPDTNGLPPEAAGASGDRFRTVSSSPAGGIISFQLKGGILPGTEGTGGFNGDPYRAIRNSSGWTSTAAGPSGVEASAVRAGGVSSDQGYSFWEASEKGSAVTVDTGTHYVRYPDGHSDLIGRGSLGTDPSAKGVFISENGAHIVFQTGESGFIAQQLEPDAPPSGTRAVYDRTADEVTHVVSLLPGGLTPAAGEGATYLGVSADGAGIAFEIGNTLYLRKDNAVTYEIGENVTFAGVSEGGERIFYVEGGDLLAFDTETEEVVEFSETGNVTPVNVAPEGTRAYFVSPSALGEENPNGALAQAGEENLYLSEEGQISFVGTVTKADVEGEDVVGFEDVNGLGLWTLALKSDEPARDPSRLTPEGSVLLFQSRAELDGQDTGGFPQIYRYDSTGGTLHCISCIPTGVPDGGGASLQSFGFVLEKNPPLSLSGYVPSLRADGKRAFFESTEALVSGDTDEVRDVYEWEDQGVGSCKQAGGCVYLISSGHSERNNFLYGHSSSGDDVFFATGDVLTGFDAGGTISIYDARANGGFAEPQAAPCEGEGCRPNLSPTPQMPGPESGARPQSGNVGKTCPKGKRQVKRHGKVRCAKKNRKHKQNRAGSKKGAAK